MSDWPALLSDYRSGFSTAHLLPDMASVSDQVWPSSNLALFFPFRIATPQIAYKLIVGAGITATGNLDAGIYDRNGNRLVSIGATAKGSSTEQVLDITDTTLGRGLYYLALAGDNGTSNFVQATASVQKLRLLGVLQMASAYVLPASATFAACSTPTRLPMVAVQFRGQ